MDRITELRNYARLNAKSPSDIYKLYVEATYELFGLVIDIPDMKDARFELKEVCNYWRCPVSGVTNWGNLDKTKPTHYPGWKFNNIRGTIRDIDGNKPSKETIDSINKDVLKEFTWGRFDTISMLGYQVGIGTGTFNGGYDFMGCFEIFLDDFPQIYNNLDSFYSAKTIKEYCGIDDFKLYRRKEKIRRIKLKMDLKKQENEEVIQ